MKVMVTVREAAESDLPAILAIYNEVIATSTAVYGTGAVDSRGSAYLVFVAMRKRLSCTRCAERTKQNGKSKITVSVRFKKFPHRVSCDFAS
jgi:hypothetical protein